MSLVSKMVDEGSIPMNGSRRSPGSHSRQATRWRTSRRQRHTSSKQQRLPHLASIPNRNETGRPQS